MKNKQIYAHFMQNLNAFFNKEWKLLHKNSFIISEKLVVAEC